MHALVSVITPCRNEVDHVDAFVRAALEQQLPAGWSLQLVVADGRSEDGTRERLERWAAQDRRLTVVDNPAGQTAAGLNRALAAARGEVVVRMDVHTRYADDYVACCLETLQRTGADCVGGPWRADPGRGRQRAIALAFGSRFGSGGAASRRTDYSGPVDTVYLGAWRRATLERHHGFDEQLLRTEDDDLAFRIVRGGGTVWQDASIRSSYRSRAGYRGLAAQMYQYGYWKVPLIRKHGRPASVRHLIPLLGLSTVAGLAVLGLWRPAFAIGAGALAAAYAVALLTAAAAATRPWRAPGTWVGVALALACMHLSYGTGFAVAVWDSVFGRSAPGHRATRLTR